MKLASLVNITPLKEGSMQARELADRNSSQQLQSMYDELLRDMEQEAEPEGGPIADQYADQMQDIEDAIQLKKGGSGGEMTYDDMIKKHYGKSPTGVLPSGKPKFDESLNESTESKWNAVDVSRTAEKELSNREWNERTAKKLAILKSLNAAGKFKKDWSEEKLQGWVDQNYSWEKLSQQFKNIGEGTCGYGKDGKVNPRDTSKLTPGGLKSMPADTRTMTMMRETIKRLIKKIHENK